MADVEMTPLSGILGRGDADRRASTPGIAVPVVVTLVEAPACHLCEDAKSVLVSLAQAYPMTIDVVSIGGEPGRTLMQHLRGKEVLLYFSEGAGCQACLVQMSQIEKDPAFAAAGLTVLPIVMNTKEQILADMSSNGVRTPFLLDDGTVSTEYGTIGKGMHAGLPGHSFVLIDKTGKQRWYGEYPSMWLSNANLLKEVHSHLAS